MQGFGQLRAAAQQVAGETSPELELAVHVERLTTQGGLEAHAMLGQPNRRLVAVGDQNIGEVRVGTPLGQAADIVDILLAGVGAEIDIGEVEIGDVRREAQEVVNALIDEAERAAGEGGVAGTRAFGRGLEHHHRGAALPGGERRIHRGIARADDDDVDVRVDLIRRH